MAREDMKLAGQKRQLLIPFFGSLALVVSFFVICASLCPSDLYGSEFPVNADCSFTSDVFVKAGTGLLFFFIIPPIGLFPIVNRSVILDGFFWPLFKPPRFHV